MLSKIDEFHASKIRFLENHRGQMAKKCKTTQKMGFCENPATPNFHGHRWWWGLFCLIGRLFGLFSYFSFWLFFLYFCTFFLHDFPTKNLMRRRTKIDDWSLSFFFFLESRRLCRALCRLFARSQNRVKQCRNDLKFDVNLNEEEIRPSIHFFLNFEAISGPVSSRLDFVAMKISRFVVRSNTVRLTWSLIGSLRGPFQDDPSTLICKSWSREAPSLGDLV